MKKLLPFLIILTLSACTLPSSVTPTPTLPPIPTTALPTVKLPTAAAPTLPPVITATPVPTVAVPTVQVPTLKLPTIQITLQPTLVLTLPPLKTIVPNTIPHLTAGTKVDILTVQMFSKTAGWAVGANTQADPRHQHVLTTSDGGATWSDVTPPEPSTTLEQGKAAKTFFLDSQHAWVAYTPQPKPASPSTGPVVWRTGDGGATWQKSAPLEFGTVEPEMIGPDSPFFLANGQTGWLIVHAGVGMNHDYIFIFKTTNAGQTWSKVIEPTDTKSNIMSCTKSGLAFANASLGWLTGSCNGVAAGVLLFQTQDGGATWKPLTLPAPAEFSTAFTANNIGCGAEPPIIISASDGYAFLPITCRGLESGVKSYSWAYASNSTLWTWGVRKAPAAALGSFDFTSATDGHFVGGGQAYRSADGGKNWGSVTTVTWEEARLSFINNNEGWAVARTGLNSALVKTTNGGVSWALLQTKIGN